MDIDVIVTIIAGVLLAVAAVGTVYPVLPGSLIAIVTVLVWAAVVGSWASWAAGISAALIAVAGWSASAVLTGRKLRERRIPGLSIVVAILASVAGMFLIPVVGLFVGFAVGLLVSEYARHRDIGAAFSSSVAALKAMGTGVLIELGMVCLASSVWTVGVIVHFVTR